MSITLRTAAAVYILLDAEQKANQVNASKIPNN